jgi:CTP:molybdopterin cytidylyltransferase MocA
VIRPNADDVRVEAVRHGASVLVNPDPDHGQLSSILTAIPAVEGCGATAMVVFPVDVPSISAEVVTAVVAGAFSETVYIARASYRGVHGHPVLFKRGVFDELRTADRSVGARAVVHADPSRVRDVEVNDPGVTVDIDTPDDYFRAFGLNL